jgi:hypothetical protein
MTDKITPLQASRFSLAEQKRSVWFIVAEAGTEKESFLNASYYAHIAARLSSGDRIEIETEDESYFAELYVREVGRNWAKVFLLREYSFDPVATEETDPEFEIKWRGKFAKFSIVRKSDSQVIFEGLDSKETAALKLKDHLKAITI